MAEFVPSPCSRSLVQDEEPEEVWICLKEPFGATEDDNSLESGITSWCIQV